METINSRVLIIDDEEIVRDSIESILIPYRAKKSEKLQKAASILFDNDESEDDQPPEPVFVNKNIPVFTVDKAINGPDGLEKIKKSIIDDSPYAIIFLDMRMPGWDGLETALHIREVDAKAEIIIVTAFSDHSIDEIIGKIGQNVGYHCKPFAAEEILQLATKAVNDYNKLRNLERLISLISNINLSETQLNPLLRNILDQLSMYIGSDTALLGKLKEGNIYEKLFSIGPKEHDIDIDRISAIISSPTFQNDEVEQVGEMVFVKVDGYTIFAVLSKERKLKTEKLYLLKLFVQNAAKAIKNIQLHEQLLQKEKLSAIGKAFGMLLHDLRTPIKSIPMLTSLMRDEGTDSELLDMIDKCGEQASEIFDDFMDFLKDAPLELRPVALDQLIADSIEATQAGANEKHVKFNVVEQTGLVVPGDYTKLKRVIINLINNAIEVLSDNKIADSTIDIRVTVVGNNAVITLKDNGPGIPAKIIENLFEAFVTHNKSNGTGLGLAIVKQYITSHNGTISVQNNDGAEFTIQLPLAD